MGLGDEISKVDKGNLGLAERVEQFLFLTTVKQGFTQDFTGEYSALPTLAGHPQRVAHVFK